MTDFELATFAMFSIMLGLLLVMKTLKDEQYIVINPYKFTILDIQVEQFP